MSQRLRLPLPIWHLQYQLLGGHRRMLIVIIATISILVVAIVGSHRLSQQPFANISRWVLIFLTGIQCFVTVLAGCNAIYRAMLRDYQSKMMESHRLTPMSNLAIVLGYLFGSTLQTLALFTVFTVTGAIVSRAGGRSVEVWVYGNLLLLGGTIMLWSASLVLGMRHEKPLNLTVIVVGFAALSFPLAFVPILGFLTGVYAGYLGIWMMVGTLSVPPAAAVVIATVSAVYSIFWISTAAVKYRRPDLPALNGARGLTLLALSLLIGVVGIVAFEPITTSAAVLKRFYKPNMDRIQWIVTLIGALLLAAVVTAGTVRCHVLGSRGTSLRGRSDRMSTLTIAILSAVLICTIMASAGASVWPRLLAEDQTVMLRDGIMKYAPVWGWTTAACLLAMLSFRSLLEIGYRLLSSPKVLVTVYLIVLWGLPPIIDSARMEYIHEMHGGAEYSWLTACCPPGMLGAIWGPLDIKLWPGLLAQLGLLLILSLVARRARRKDRARMLHLDP